MNGRRGRWLFGFCSLGLGALLVGVSLAQEGDALPAGGPVEFLQKCLEKYDARHIKG